MMKFAWDFAILLTSLKRVSFIHFVIATALSESIKLNLLKSSIMQLTQHLDTSMNCSVSVQYV